jgi:hypothetical protein
MGIIRRGRISVKNRRMPPAIRMMDGGEKKANTMQLRESRNENEREKEKNEKKESNGRATTEIWEYEKIQRGEQMVCRQADHSTSDQRRRIKKKKKKGKATPAMLCLE